MLRRQALIGAVLVAAAAVCSLAAASSQRFYTHRFTVTGTYVDHWTVDDPSPCGLVGGGTVSVSFHLAKPTKVRLFYDKSATKGGGLRGVGNWVVGVPAGGGVGQADNLPAAGTITLVDNTTQRPPDPGDTCSPKPSADCGATPLARAALDANGYDAHHLLANLDSRFDRKGGSGRFVQCPIGQARSFSDRTYSGMKAEGYLVLPMVSKAAVAHRRLIRVTGSSHKVTPGLRCGGTCSDDVTRQVTFTFRKL